MKRYLGAVLAAFLLGCAGPLTVGVAQAAEEPEGDASLLGSVTATVGALAGGDDGQPPGADEPAPVVPDGDAAGHTITAEPEQSSSAQAPTPKPEPAPPEPEPEPEPASPESNQQPKPSDPGIEQVPDTETADILGTVTTTVNRLADAPRNLLAGVAGDDTPVPDVPAPGSPEPGSPEPDAPGVEPPAKKPSEPAEPKKPEKTGVSDRATADAPAASAVVGPSAAGNNLSGVGQVGFTGLEHTQPRPPQHSITRPNSAEPDRTAVPRPSHDVPAFIDPTNSTTNNPTDQEKSPGDPPADVRADAVSLAHVTRMPFSLAIVLLTAVGVLTVRRVVTAK